MRRKKEPVNENGIAIRKGVLPDKTTRITISNQLIEASNKLSLLQLWILFVLISNIDRRDNVFMEYGFYAKDLARAFNMEEKHCYDAMKKAVKGLVSSYVTVKSEGMSGSVEEDIPWVHNAIYRPHNALIVLRLNDGLRPHLLQLSQVSFEALISQRHSLRISLRFLLRQHRPYSFRRQMAYRIDRISSDMIAHIHHG